MNSVSVPEDRSIAIDEGKIVKTGYVPIHHVRMGCRDRMAIGDVEAAHRRQLALAGKQRWPPPTGEWDGPWFVLHDGRHSYIAALMIGLTHLLVAWVADPEDGQ